MRTKDYGDHLDQTGLDHNLHKDLDELIGDICDTPDFDRSEAIAALRRAINDPDF